MSEQKNQPGTAPGRSAAEWWLRGLLWFFGVNGLLAIVPTLMPRAWLATAVAYAQPGASLDLLDEYLARALSAMCVLLGGLLCLSATDPLRYRPMIYWMAGFLLVGGGGECVVLGLAPYPKNLVWYLLCADGGLLSGFGLVVLILLGRLRDCQISGR